MAPEKQSAVEETMKAAAASRNSDGDEEQDVEMAPPTPPQNAKAPPASEPEEAPEPPSLERTQARQISRVGAIAVAGIGASRPLEDDVLESLEQAASVPPPLVATSTLGSSIADESLPNAVNVTATLVTDDEYEAELHRVIMKTSVKASRVEPINEEEKHRGMSPTRWCLTLVGIFFVLVVLGVTLFLAAVGSDFRDNDDSVSPPSSEDLSEGPESAYDENDLEQFLKQRSFDQGEALRDYNSPQRIALRYIAAEFPQATLDEEIIDLYALATLFFSTGGTFWTLNTSWKSSSSVCTWHGVQCDDTNHVVSISLRDNKLVGTIPPEIALLAPRPVGDSLLTTGLVALDLSQNGIGGPIPTEISQLASLEEVSLQDNEFVGDVPPGMANWTSARILSLEGNHLVGEIPTALCQFTSDIRVSVDCEEVSCACCQPTCTNHSPEKDDEGSGNEGNDDGLRRKL